MKKKKRKEKRKEKKEKEKVCSSTKSIFDDERRDFLSLLPNKLLLSQF